MGGWERGEADGGCFVKPMFEEGERGRCRGKSTALEWDG